MIQTKVIIVMLCLFPLALLADEDMAVVQAKIEAYAALDEMRNINIWCSKKYPSIRSKTEMMEEFIRPRLEKVEGYIYNSDRSERFKVFLKKLDERKKADKIEAFAYYENNYDEKACKKIIDNRLKNGFDKKIEDRINL